MRKASWIISALAVMTVGMVYLRPLKAQTGGMGGAPGMMGSPGMMGQSGGGGMAGPSMGQPGGAARPSSGAPGARTGAAARPGSRGERREISEKTQNVRRVDLTPLLSALSATGSYGRATGLGAGRPLTPVQLAHYLVPDRLLIRGGIWRVGIIDVGTRYHRFNCPLMLLADPGKVAGFASWQEAMAAGYTADPVCNPSPVAEVMAVAREITRGGPVELDPREVQMVQSLLPPELVEVLQRAADKAEQPLLFAPRPQQQQGAGGGGEGGMMGGGAMPGMGGGSGGVGAPMPGMAGMGGGGYNLGGGMMPSIGAPGGGIAMPGS